MPRVEDSTGFTVSPIGCKHRVLFFGSGGYLVICSECSQIWEAKKIEYSSMPEEPVIKPAPLGPADKRIDQDMLDPDMLAELAKLMNSSKS
jgi:hypothetical protein